MRIFSTLIAFPLFVAALLGGLPLLPQTPVTPAKPTAGSYATPFTCSAIEPPWVTGSKSPAANARSIPALCAKGRKEFPPSSLRNYQTKFASSNPALRSR